MSNNILDLQNKWDILDSEVNHLKLENSILSKYIDKKTIELGADEEDKKKKKNRAKQQTVNTLTTDQKYEIANVIHEDITLEAEEHRKNSEKNIETLKAVLEETDIRIGELKRDTYEFKRNVVVGAENGRTGKIMAEKAARYFEDKLRNVDAVIEKLRLKNSTIKSQLTKVEAQLNQKQEVGDALHYIDFHQLQIENKQYVAKIDERNEELLQVKVTAGRTIQALNDYKKRLNEKLEHSQWLKNEIIEKKRLMLKLENDVQKVNKEMRIENSTKNHLRQSLEETSEMPSIENYIDQKKIMYEYESTLKTWQKKVELMEMAAKKSRMQVASRA